MKRNKKQNKLVWASFRRAWTATVLVEKAEEEFGFATLFLFLCYMIDLFLFYFILFYFFKAKKENCVLYR